MTTQHDLAIPVQGTSSDRGRQHHEAFDKTGCTAATFEGRSPRKPGLWKTLVGARYSHPYPV